MPRKQPPSRRQFLTNTAALAGGALATPYIFTASARAQEIAKTDRPVIALIGCGSQGGWDMAWAMQHADVAAVCDVDANHLGKAQKAAGEKADATDDYRRILDRKDVNA